MRLSLVRLLWTGFPYKEGVNTKSVVDINKKVTLPLLLWFPACLLLHF